MAPILELIDVSKRYGGVRALERARFACAPGRIHALLGENGAGKSTLIKIMSGVVQPDEGRLLLHGQERRFAHPQDGSVFGNRERRLPRREHGYYREYTVPTPGLKHRGARRIVTGGDPPAEWYYTADHYGSFRRFDPPAREATR